MSLSGETKAVTATEASPHKDAEERKKHTEKDVKGRTEEEESCEDRDTEHEKGDLQGREEDHNEDTSAQDKIHDTEEEEEEVEEEYENDDSEQEGEAEESEHSDDEGEQKAINIDLSCMKSLYQFRSRPTLPYLLTEYGMEDKDVPVKKQKEKKKKKRSFGDDMGRDKERDKQQEERHLQIVNDMKKLRDYYYEEYSALLQNKVDQQRQEIRQRTTAMRNKIAQQEEMARQESHRVKRRLERHKFVSDDSFLQDLPKTDLYHITQLQDKLIKEGKLKSQSDFDAFWRRIQQPDIFYLYFKVPKSDDVKDYGDYNDNASTKAPSTTKGSSMNSSRLSPPPLVGKKGGEPRCLSRIAETRETSRPGTRTDQHWAITQQFPAQHKGEQRHRSSFSGMLKPGPVHSKTSSSYLQELEKRFPKLEMPKLHCFTMQLGPKPPDPDEVRHQIHLKQLEKERKKYTYKLTRMHQLAMANAAAASRILETHEDMDFILNGSPLTDLISDQHFYTGLPPTHSITDSGPLCSSPVLRGDVSRQLFSLQEQDEDNQSFAQSALQSAKSSKRGESRKSKRSQKSPKSPAEKSPEPIPLSLGEVVDNSRIMSAKCMSTLWTNYMKEAPPAKS